MKSKIDKLEKKIRKLNAQELRQLERLVNEIRILQIKNRLKK